MLWTFGCYLSLACSAATSCNRLRLRPFRRLPKFGSLFCSWPCPRPTLSSSLCILLNWLRRKRWGCELSRWLPYEVRVLFDVALFYDVSVAILLEEFLPFIWGNIGSRWLSWYWSNCEDDAPSLSLDLDFESPDLSLMYWIWSTVLNFSNSWSRMTLWWLSTKSSFEIVRYLGTLRSLFPDSFFISYAPISTLLVE